MSTSESELATARMAGRVERGRRRKLTLCGCAAWSTRAAGRIEEFVAVKMYQAVPFGSVWPVGA